MRPDLAKQFEDYKAKTRPVYRVPDSAFAEALIKRGLKHWWTTAEGKPFAPPDFFPEAFDPRPAGVATSDAGAVVPLNSRVSMEILPPDKQRHMDRARHLAKKARTAVAKRVKAAQRAQSKSGRKRKGR